MLARIPHGATSFEVAAVRQRVRHAGSMKNVPRGSASQCELSARRDHTDHPDREVIRPGRICPN